MSKLIATVVVATLVAGVRTEYQPGEEVPGLNPVDAADLKKIEAVYDEDELAADQKAAARADKAAGAEFAKARKDVLARSEAVEAQAS
jgi:hypothetical protein